MNDIASAPAPTGHSPSSLTPTQQASSNPSKQPQQQPQQTQQQDQQHRKRVRVSRACDECRLRKTRCDGRQPCAGCQTFERRKRARLLIKTHFIELIVRQTVPSISTKAANPLNELEYWRIVSAGRTCTSKSCKRNCRGTSRSMLMPFSLFLQRASMARTGMTSRRTSQGRVAPERSP